MPYKFEHYEIFGLGERGSGFKARSLQGFQDFKKIREKCVRDNILFEDDEFPATDASIGNMEDDTQYIWKRPSEIVEKFGKKPRFIVGGADRFDVRQGDLGNCWLLAAISDITLSKDLFRVLVPQNNSFSKNYCGAFHFRFWQFGKWIDVVIDDRLPCNKDGELAFLNPATKNEFWSPLLEKAYAKLNVSYASLNGGYTLEALADFTGGFTEVIFLDKLQDIDIRDNEELFDILIRSFERSSFMGINVKANPDVVEDVMENGLIRGHAYSITDLRVIKAGGKELRLFRIRNPWGTDAEWKGDWSDKSPLWNTISPEDKTSLAVTDAADGEFWMSYDDFLENMERIELCHMAPFSEEGIAAERQGGQSKEWVSHSFQGNWIRGVTAGGAYKYKDTFANNPQYLMKLGDPETDKEENTVVICLLKKARKLEPEANEVTHLVFSMFGVKPTAPKPLDTAFFKDSKNKPVPLPMKPIKTLREITIRLMVPSGTYVIVPSSLHPDVEGDFLMRVFTEGKSEIHPYDEDVSIEEKEIEVKDATVEDKAQLERSQQFFKIVAGEHEEVNWWNLKLILDKSFHDEFRYEGFGFSEEVCRSLVALMDVDKSGKLGFFEFTNLWTQVMAWRNLFNEHDKKGDPNSMGTLNTNDLRNALKAGGYVVNKDLMEDVVLRYGDQRGEVSLDKFIIAAIKIKTMIELFKRRQIKGQDKAMVSLKDWLTETIYS